MKKFRDYVEWKLKELGMTKAGLAKKAHISSATLARTLEGEYPPVERLVRIAIALHIEPILIEQFLHLAGRCFSYTMMGYQLFYSLAYEMECEEAIIWLIRLEKNGNMWHSGVPLPEGRHVAEVSAGQGQME